MKAAGASEGLRNFTGLECCNHVDKQRRDLFTGHPAERTAFERRRALGVAYGHCAKVGTVHDLLIDVVKLRPHFLDVLGRRCFWQGDQNMRQAVIGIDDDVVFKVRDTLFDLTRRYVYTLSDIDAP